MLEVNPDSSRILRDAVETCARCFKHEMEFNFVQFSGKYPDEAQKAYLFYETILNKHGKHMSQVVDAACFVNRKYTNCPEHTVLQWIWLHPFVRNKNVINNNVMDIWNKRFGYWFPEEPLSKTMKGFIKKHGLIDPVIKFNIDLT